MFVGRAMSRSEAIGPIRRTCKQAIDVRTTPPAANPHLHIHTTALKHCNRQIGTIRLWIRYFPNPPSTDIIVVNGLSDASLL